MTLLTVPNASEGRDAKAVERLSAAFAGNDALLLDTHSDPTHNRSVFSLAAEAGLDEILERGARAAIDAIDMRRHDGAHPCVGALDVAPVVWLRSEDEGRARASAIAAAERIAALGIPVFLYGALASDPARAERAFFRRGGLAALPGRMTGGLRPDFGPGQPHESAGATLVTARPPLAAFNMTLASDDGEVARLIAAELRESGGGPPGVRAIGVEMRDGTVQVSTNVHDPINVPLAEVVSATRALAGSRGLELVAGEIVGLVPRAALIDFPADLPLPGFDQKQGVIENRIAAEGRQPQA